MFHYLGFCQLVWAHLYRTETEKTSYLQFYYPSIRLKHWPWNAITSQKSSVSIPLRENLPTQGTVMLTGTGRIQKSNQNVQQWQQNSRKKFFYILIIHFPSRAWSTVQFRLHLSKIMDQLFWYMMCLPLQCITKIFILDGITHLGCRDSGTFHHCNCIFKHILDCCFLVQK